MGRTVERVALPAIKRWAHGVGRVDDLGGLADALCQILRDPERTQLAEVPEPGAPATADGSGLASPNLGGADPLDQLSDGVCLALQRFLSPAREGDPRLLGELLHLALRLRIDGAKETIAGLLIGGAYRGQEGPEGPLDEQMATVLRACGLDDDERGLLRGLLGDRSEDVERVTPEAPVSLPGLGDGKPPAIFPGDQVPQVNDPDQVFAFVDGVKEGIADRRAYAEHARVSIRQADFVARAAAALGLVQVERGGVFQVTELGLRVPFAEDPAGRAIRHQIVAEHPLVQALDLQDTETLPTLDRIQVLLAERTELGTGTIKRRAQALRRWVEWWASGGR